MRNFRVAKLQLLFFGWKTTLILFFVVPIFILVCLKIGHPHPIPSHGSSSCYLRKWSQMGVYKPLSGPNHIHVGRRIWFQQEYVGLKIIFRPSFMIPSDQCHLDMAIGHWVFPAIFWRMRRRLWKQRRRRSHLEKMEHRSRQNQRFVGTNAGVILFFWRTSHEYPWIWLIDINLSYFEVKYRGTGFWHVLTPSSSRFQSTRLWYLTRKGTESVLCNGVTPPKIQIGQQFGYHAVLVSQG